MFRRRGFQFGGSVLSIILLLFVVQPIYGQSQGLKVIVSNYGEDGTVCVYPRLGCRILSSDGTMEFQFSNNEVRVGEEFKACLRAQCKTGINSQENRPEYVTFGSEEAPTSLNDYNDMKRRDPTSRGGDFYECRGIEVQ